MLNEVVKKDWKYQVKSTLWTFFSLFIPLLLVQIQDLSLVTVQTSFMAGGLVAGLRAFARIIVEPLAIACWGAFKGLLHWISIKMKQ